MDISVHLLPNAHPVETGWVDDAIADAHTDARPLGVLIGRTLTAGPGIMLVARPSAGGDRHRLFETRRGRSRGPARYLHFVAFDGPRSEEWTRAEQRAADERIWPATRDIAGIVQVLRMRAPDGAYIVGILTDSVEAIEAASTAIMSTPLLPDEDPRLLSRPDRIEIYHLVHNDLPTDTATIPTADHEKAMS